VINEHPPMHNNVKTHVTRKKCEVNAKCFLVFSPA